MQGTSALRNVKVFVEANFAGVTSTDVGVRNVLAAALTNPGEYCGPAQQYLMEETGLSRHALRRAYVVVC